MDPRASTIIVVKRKICTPAGDNKINNNKHHYHSYHHRRLAELCPLPVYESTSKDYHPELFNSVG
jgi:hypothetical protein